MFELLAASTVGLALGGSTRTSPPDACAELLPVSLRSSLSSHFPGYRLPTQADNDDSDVAYNRGHGGTGCLGAAVGDFNGDGDTDVAVLLWSQERRESIVVVGLRRSGSWGLETLRHHGPTRSKYYLSSAAPGTYARTKSLDGPVSEPGEAKRIVTRNTSILTGALESTGILYAFVRGRWVHVWVSD